MSITVIIVVLTCVVSFVAFSNHKLLNDLIFYPPAISEQNQWYRFFTCGLIHDGMGHLAFNMIALYLFGRNLEGSFSEIYGEKGALVYALLYITALAASMVPTYSQQKDNYHYRSLGASGAVSAIVFAGILIFPLQKMGLLFLPIMLPGFIFGPIYLIASAYMSKKGHGNINHSAHIWGAIYGVAFVIVTSLVLSDFNPITNFIEEIKSYLQ